MKERTNYIAVLLSLVCFISDILHICCNFLLAYRLPRAGIDRKQLISGKHHVAISLKT